MLADALKLSRTSSHFAASSVKKYCIISIVDVGEMDTNNIDSKTAKTLSHQPVNCTAEESRQP